MSAAQPGSTEAGRPAPPDLPWRLDRDPLDEHTVAGLLARRFDDLREAEVRRLGQGWDFEAFVVDENWVFRFPHREECVSWQFREGRTLDALAGRLPLAIPRHERFGEAGEDFPYPFVGHRMLPGLGGEALLPSRLVWSDVAMDLGRFLGALQRIPVVPLLDMGLPTEEGRYGALVEKVVEFAPALAPRLGPAGRSVLDAVTGGRLPPPPPRSKQVVLLHSDLFLEHLIFDPPSGRLTGVIDWADARAGERIGDLVPIWVFFGEAFFAQLLEGYGYELGEDEIARIRTLGTVRLLRWMGEIAHYGWFEANGMIAWGDAYFFPRMLGSEAQG